VFALASVALALFALALPARPSIANPPAQNRLSPHVHGALIAGIPGDLTRCPGMRRYAFSE
jgi:hypothetical protein